MFAKPITTPITAARCAFARDDAPSILDRAPLGEGTSYRENLRIVIETYGGVPEELGNQLARFVAGLPKGADVIRDGYIAHTILTAASEELQLILDEGDYLDSTARGQAPKGDFDIDYLRRQARTYDIEMYGTDEERRKVAKSAEGCPDSGPDNEGIRGSYYRAGSATGREREISDSAAGPKRRQFEFSVDIAEIAPAPAMAPAQTKGDIPLAAAGNGGDHDLSKASFGSQPVPANSGENAGATPTPPAAPIAKPFKVIAPDYSRSEPNSAFKSGMRWLGDILCLIASGSRKEGYFPRVDAVSPTALPASCAEFAVKPQEMAAAAQKVRQQLNSLRPPSGGGMDGMMDGLKSIDPNDPGALEDLFNNFMGGPKREAWQDDSEGWKNQGGWSDSD